MSRARNYCFTINNYTEEHLQIFNELSNKNKHNYLCYGLEVGKEGTPHIQGYIQLLNAMTISALQKYIGVGIKFHTEKSNGTLGQNQLYCSKDGNYIEWGEPKQKGKRNDLLKLKEQMYSNPQNIEKLIEDSVENYQQLRFVECLSKYTFKHRDYNIPPTVIWCYGSTGSGKTKFFYDNFKDICSVSDYSWLGTGYTQNEVYLMDDFRRTDLSYNRFLKLTGRFPYTLNVKGGHIPFNSPYIIITTPLSIAETFPYENEDNKQIYRRFTMEVNFDDPESINELNILIQNNNLVIDYNKCPLESPTEVKKTQE